MPEPATLQQELRDLIAQVIEVEPETVTPEAKLVDDLQADSMNALEITALIENRYGIVIEPDRMPDMVSLQAIQTLVAELLESRG